MNNKELIKTLNDYIETKQGIYLDSIIDALNLKELKYLPDKYKRIDYVLGKIIKEVENLHDDTNLKDLYNELNPKFLSYISDENYKKQWFTNEFEKVYESNGNMIWGTIVDVLTSINDDFIKKDFYDKYFNRIDEEYLAKLLSSINDDEYILSKIDYFDDFYSEVLAVAISGISDDNVKMQIFKEKEELLETGKTDIIASLKSDELKVKYLNEMGIYSQKIISSIQDDNIKISLLDLITEKKSRHRVVKSIKNEDIRISCFKKYGIDMANLIDSISILSSDKKKIDMLEFLSKDNPSPIQVTKIIGSMDSDMEKLTALSLCGSNKTSFLLRRHDIIKDDKVIFNNIDLFLKYELLSLDDFEKKKDIVSTMYAKNNLIVKRLNFAFIDDKYVNTLGLDKINLISTFIDLQDNILDLNDKQYPIFFKTLENYSQKYGENNWTLVVNQLSFELSRLNKDKFEFATKTLIDNIDNLDNINISNLTKVLLDGNPFKITTLEELENYDEIIEKKCDEQIKSSDIYDKINAISIKLCGIGKDTNMLRNFAGINRKNTWDLVRLYGDDIDKIEDSPYKDIIIAMKQIQKEKEPEKLEEFYHSIPKFNSIDVFEMESELKKAYLDLYNKILLNVDDLEKNEEGFYEAGTDFNIITTSIGAYVANSPDDYREDWNRASLASQHFCTNFIRNDMLGTAPIPHVSYGFSSMEPDSLLLAGPADIYSSSGESFISQAHESEKYCSPETMINETHKSEKFRYNEMDFKRIQGSEKKQPDYILVFRKDNVISNLDEAKKASKQWGDLPIVVVDVDKCLKSERSKVDTMINEYANTQSLPLMKQIIQKIANNKVTNPNFANDIDLDKVNTVVVGNSSLDAENVSSAKKH